MRNLTSSGVRVFSRQIQRRMISGPFGLLTTSFVSLVFIVAVFYFNFYLHNGNHIRDSGKSKSQILHHQPNRTWMKLRKELLDDPDSKTKVVLMSYMRGGTTLFSEIFNLHPQSDVLWHEPMDAFYESYSGLQPHSVPLTLLYYKNFTRRILSDRERNEVTEYLFNLLHCRPEKIPLETFVHYHLSYSAAFYAIAACMEEKKAKHSVANCTFKLGNVCGHSDLIRRDMSVSYGNKCPDIISVIKSFLQENSSAANQEVTADEIRSEIRGDITPRPSASRHHLLMKLLSIFSGQFGRNSNQTKETIELLLDHQLCLSQLRPLVSHCIRPAFDVCRKAKMTTLKLIRVMFDDLEELVRRIPDIHVIYYVRDPRAIVTSRTKPETRLTMSNKDETAVTEARILCHRMSEDLRARTRLQRIFPGSISTIRYEDFVRRPRKHTADVFKSIGRPVPVHLDSWIKSRFGGQKDNGIYGTVRTDPVLTSDNWMSEVSLKNALEMELSCHEVLRELGYMTMSQDNADDDDDDSRRTQEHLTENNEEQTEG